MTKTPTDHQPKRSVLGIPVTADGYLDLGSLQAKVNKKKREREEEQKKYFNNVRRKSLKKYSEDQELFGKALQRMKEDNEARRNNEIAKAKAEAVNSINEEAERKHGVKSDKAKRLDNAWRDTLKNLI
ncbi:hypothetical protein SEQ01_06720 [Streptococcus equinus]|uniref:hypothetical protein n=1 Tax=Streptococcus equinus TaxID=1335 RepID=UPI001142B69B|nr:hypothetical protein [Streptococcus equinus]GEB10481.1 hypothetical protein SEQ01_06720 [Streptococcus equinus]